MDKLKGDLQEQHQKDMEKMTALHKDAVEKMRLEHKEREAKKDEETAKKQE